METYPLIRHPDTPALAVTGVSASLVAVRGGWLELRWRIEGARRLVLPAFAGKGRADGLWRTTCFELFASAAETDDDGAYCEFNLSPSERWAAYDFCAYRAGMSDRPVPREPVCTPRRGGALMIFDAAIPLGALPPLPLRTGLGAVIEEEGGRISYWALAHPPGKPDFHHRACFAAGLAPPQAP